MKAAILCCVLLAGCSSTGQAHPDDPFEPVNREVFAFNHTLDNRAAMPAATYYKSALPTDMRDGMHNFLANLTLPVTFANDLLQGEVTQAGYAVCRLGVNTTAGVLGVMDPASGWGCPAHDEDFGQTLAIYGVPGGPYMVLPLLGSTLPRDAVGKILVDHYFNPLGYVAYRGKYYVSISENVIKLVDQRSRSVNALSDIERTSIDYYAAVRSIYLQKRDSAIQNTTLAPDPAAK
jgi:phospholipid-binding lipoprotein MlaA